RNWALACALLLFLFGFNCRVQIGIRLVLPCVALAAIGLAAATVHALSQLEDSWKRPALQFATFAGIAWMTTDSLATWPDGLRFVNELWGGRASGYRIVSDSNYDWGQGLPDLGRWQSEHHVSKLDVWYFGTDPALKSQTFHSVPFHTLPIQSPDDVRDRVAGRYLAVGTSVLYAHGLTE